LCSSAILGDAPSG